MFRIRIIASPQSKLRTAGSLIVGRLMVKMNLFMFKVQSKIVGEEIPSFFPKGAPNIAATVRAIPATVEGTVIRGQVEAGGPRTTKETLGGPRAGQPVDYAGVQEAGVAHSWQIRPVLFSSAWAISQKSRVLSVSGLPRALAFLLNGKLMIVRSVTIPGLQERPYMRKGLADMEAEITEGLNQELAKLLSAGTGSQESVA